MLLVKLLFIAASLLAQAHFLGSTPADPDEGNVRVTASDSALAEIRARLAVAEAPSSDASPADSDSSRSDAPIASR